MKTRLLIITGIIMILGIVLALVVIDGWQGHPIPKSLLCGGDFIQQGNGCVLDPELIEPNTIMIYQATDHGGTRLAITPHTLVINLQENNTITWINQGVFTAAVNHIEMDSQGTERGLLWSIDEIKPSTQKSIQFNSTGFYFYHIVTGSDGESGDIVVLGDDVNSLPVDERAKMAQSILSSTFRNNVELHGVGSGSAEPGITLHIDKKFRDKHDDAEKFYYEKYKEMIPFDVPITIEFLGPITLD